MNAGRNAQRAVPVHYLRPNESVWTPPTLVCLDTETRWAADGDREIHSLRLWVARCTDRRTPPKVTPRDDYARGETGEELAHQVHAWCRDRRPVWIYAHNLHFDLTVSDLTGQLCLLGWDVTDFAVDGAAPFVRLARGEKRITICDSFSWMPVSLQTVASALSTSKVPLPCNSDTLESWITRCRQDVKVLSDAMLALMDWWDANELGRWSITGGSSGWNVMRHIPANRKILIDPNPDLVAGDRQAIYGGRRGQWRTGKQPAGRYSELDLERAYTAVCRDLPLPCERVSHFTSLPIDHPWVTSARYGIIAKVLIETDDPRWPVRIGRRVWYPVGRYWTILAGPEIAEAARLGCLRAIGEGWRHRLGYALRPWALWCLAQQADETGFVPEVAKIALKHWGRTVVGKWAQRGFERTELGAAPTNGWNCIEGWNNTRGVRASIVDFAGTRWQVTASGQCDNTYPAILAFVESYVRASLSRAIDAIGPDAMISCDTDGMIVDLLRCYRQPAASRNTSGDRMLPAGAPPQAVVRAAVAAEPLHLREKTFYRYVDAIGPQHTILDGRRRFAGVPASATELPDGRLAAQLWPKLAWQMAHGRAGTYVRPVQTYRVGGTYAPGWVLTDGSVTPVEVACGLDGSVHILPWPWTRHAAAGARLGPHQNPHLEANRDPPATSRNTEDYPGQAEGRGEVRLECAQTAP